MRQVVITVGSLVLLSALAGCGLRSAFDMGKDSPASQNQLCSRLKREIVFQNFNSNHDTNWTSPARQADILRQYQDNRCEELLSGKAQAKADDAAVSPLTLPSDKASQKNNIQVRVE